MSSFKPKSFKQITVNQKSVTTLDGKHTEIAKRFKNDEEVVIPNYLKEIENLQERLNNIQEQSTECIENVPDNSGSGTNLTHILVSNSDHQTKRDIEDRIKKLKSKIKKLEKERKDYYLKNSEHIFGYFEQKKGLEEGQSKTRKLDAFFNKRQNNEIVSAVGDKCADTVKQYLKNVDESFLDINEFIVQKDICPLCRKGELIPVEHEGLVVCNRCSTASKFLVENEKPSYKEPPKEVCFYAYRRINHFREVLAQFQAKETTNIPEEVLEAIKNQAKKERIPLTEEWFDNARAKEMLKKLRLNRYYEHIPYIKDKLGIRPPVMSPDLEEVLCNLFMILQAPYAKYCPDDRSNFLNYYYTGFKLCELVDQRQFLPYFQMLKDDDKLYEQDQIWQKMCEELGWPFIPTERKSYTKNKSLWDLTSDWEKSMK